MSTAKTIAATFAGAVVGLVSSGVLYLNGSAFTQVAWSDDGQQIPTDFLFGPLGKPALGITALCLAVSWARKAAKEIPVTDYWKGFVLPILLPLSALAGVLDVNNFHYRRIEQLPASTDTRANQIICEILGSGIHEYRRHKVICPVSRP